jgi:hypothetical protein
MASDRDDSDAVPPARATRDDAPHDREQQGAVGERIPGVDVAEQDCDGERQDQRGHGRG